MIGNDIVDLVKAKEESNIFRPRYLEKVCTQDEINVIKSSSDSIISFWRIWTMKESAYKAFQRKFGFKTKFNPTAFSCEIGSNDYGKVRYQDESIPTKTIQAEDFMYSEVIDDSETNKRFFGTTSEFLNCLKNKHSLGYFPKIYKSTAGFPIINLGFKICKISKTHHGNFQAFQY